MNADELLRHYERVADAPDTAARLRRFVLDLAVRGTLVPPEPADEPADVLLEQLQFERDRRVAAGEFREPSSVAPIERAKLPFSVPSHWRWARLIDVAQPSYGFAFASGQFNSSKRGMPLIRIRDISGNDTEAYFDGSFDPAYVVNAGDYLVGMDGDFNLRRWRGKPGLLNQRVLRINDWRCGVSSEFVKLPLQFILDYLNGQTSQTTVKHLSAKQVNGIHIPLPPLAEQHRIVNKVDELMALCDELEAARAEREAARDRLTAASLARLNTPDSATFVDDARFALDALPAAIARADQIKLLRQAIVNLAVQGKLVAHESGEVDRSDNPISDTEASTNLPKGWRFMRLDSLLAEDTRNGYSRRPDDAAGGTPILRISAGTVRRDGVVAEEEHKLISGIDSLTHQQYAVRTGDLLACRFNGNKAFVGRLTIFKDYLGLKPIYPDKLIRIRIAQDRAVPEFLRLSGDSDLVRSQIEALCATTVGNWGVSAANLKEVRFPIPSLHEQRRIVTKVEELMTMCDRLEASLVNGSEHRRRLLDALLHEALTPAAEPEEVA